MNLRLALRLEDGGKKWSCYIAKIDSMEGAVWIASVAARVVSDEDRKTMFIKLMKAAFRDMVLNTFGVEVNHMETKIAPEEER